MADPREIILEFCSYLRAEYGFDTGHPQAHDALRAIEYAGVGRQRMRLALRAVCCSRVEQLPAFDRAFEEFFLQGHRLPPRIRSEREPSGEGLEPQGAERIPAHRTAAAARDVLFARYSPSQAQAPDVPRIEAAGIARSLADATQFLNALRRGRSRAWKPQSRGARFDLRRTLRRSLRTGGDPARIERLGHPHRNPRVVLILDASRSMSPEVPALLRFAYALCRRSSRASAFLFSTELREITASLRSAAGPAEAALHDLGHAWGGGTRIGEALLECLQRYGSRFDAHSIVLIASDGLDAGEPAPLRSAMQQLHRRCAGVLWLNPHTATPGFEPAARGMQAAMPYLDALLDARDTRSLAAAARSLRR